MNTEEILLVFDLPGALCVESRVSRSLFLEYGVPTTTGRECLGSAPPVSAVTKVGEGSALISR